MGHISKKCLPLLHQIGQFRGALLHQIFQMGLESRIFRQYTPVTGCHCGSEDSHQQQAAPFELPEKPDGFEEIAGMEHTAKQRGCEQGAQQSYAEDDTAKT